VSALCGGFITTYRRIGNCPNCKCRRRMVVGCAGWWGSTQYCCGCGTKFTEDGWRKPARTKAPAAISYAKELWSSAVTCKEAFAIEREYLFGETA